MTRYVVCGNRRVFGADPGETVEKDLPQDQERRLVRAGRIKPAAPAVNEEEDQDG